MNVKTMVVALMALFMSAGAYAQSQTQVYKVKPRLTSEQRAARKAEMKAKLAQMTPAERKAFKQAHRQQMQARLNAMTPEQRERVMQRRREHKALKQQSGR
ncbi:hypothetical protein HNV11_20420 [Spirosoma taeanense]|uniref:DUF4890 domain-containing protein n=1 Tax=Spirosoma taeanense TaxID=2735870 RepID=A0A6M5YC12_9BACT|nr:hypothetical protein [Spirosoma taeanense]QJW91575.1 hypothetical protein HNV11_20420 [Spirosoma taeanense]